MASPAARKRSATGRRPWPRPGSPSARRCWPGTAGPWQDLAKTGWTDWYADAERAFLELSSRCSQVFVAGLSMGGCLALRLAETQGSGVSGVVVVNPSLAADTPLIALAPALK